MAPHQVDLVGHIAANLNVAVNRCKHVPLVEMKIFIRWINHTSQKERSVPWKIQRLVVGTHLLDCFLTLTIIFPGFKQNLLELIEYRCGICNYFPSIVSYQTATMILSKFNIDWFQDVNHPWFNTTLWPLPYSLALWPILMHRDHTKIPIGHLFGLRPWKATVECLCPCFVWYLSSLGSWITNTSFC